MASVYDFEANTLEGKPAPLSDYRGKVLLIVNTASQCGFTPQYEGLEALHKNFQARGFEVLGFPCNQFGHQEPGSADEIRSFCDMRFGVTFPLFQKIDVNGADTHPLYQFLKAEAPGLLVNAIKWNFTKFLVRRDGSVAKRYAPADTPASIATDIEAALA